MLNRVTKFTLLLGVILLIAFIAHAEARVNDNTISEYVEVPKMSWGSDEATSSPDVSETTDGGLFTDEPEKETTIPGVTSTASLQSTASPKNEMSTTGVPNTDSPPIKFTLYIRETKEEFQKKEAEFKRTLADVLNKGAADSVAPKFFKMFAVFAQIAASDIQIAMKEGGNGFLQLDITVSNTQMSAENAKEQVIASKDRFKDMGEIFERIPTHSGSSGGLKAWEIALIVIGTVAAVAIIMGGIFFIVHKKNQKTRVGSAVGDSHRANGKLDGNSTDQPNREDVPMQLNQHNHDNPAYN